MAKKITLVTIADQIAKMDSRMESGFAALAEDMTDVRKDMATKEQLLTLHTQVTSIETQLRDMRHVKLQSRVADLEEEVFGKTRG